MKKILAMLLAMAMAFSLAACGGKKGADDIPDTMTSQDGKSEGQVLQPGHLGRREAVRQRAQPVL